MNFDRIKMKATLLICACVVLGSAPGEGAEPNPSASSAPPQNFKASPSWSSSSHLHGIARAKNETEMRSAVAGVVRQVHVPQGSRINKGETLISLEDSIPRAAWKAAWANAARRSTVEAARVEYELLEKQVERVKKALAERASSPFELEAKSSQRDKARAEYNVQVETYNAAQASLELAAAELAQFHLRAPFDGQLVRLDKKVGQPVDPSETILMLVDASTLEIEMFLPIDWFGEIKVGRRYQLEADAPVNRTVTATAKYASPIVDSTSGTFRCIFEIDNADLRLPAGFSVTLGNL